MKTAPIVVVLAAVAALIGVSGSAPVPAQPAPKAAQYEYKFLPLNPGKVQEDEKALNDLAADGWEVVTETAQKWFSNEDTRLVLKRAKR